MNSATVKPCIYLASDSTVQTYPKENKPQTGWGQVLIQYFAKDGETPLSFHPANTVFEHVTRYETECIAIDNRAYAGRSAKTFWEEGRFEDFRASLSCGDYVFLQFAHNDANEKKPERFIPVSEYPLWLDRYVKAIKEAGAIPVLVTAIAMRTFLEDGILPVSFPQYRTAMIKYAVENNIACLDLGEASRAYCEKAGPEGTKNIFMWTSKGEYPGGPYCEGTEDNAHLKYDGAVAFAGLLAKAILKCPKLKDLASMINTSLLV